MSPITKTTHLDSAGADMIQRLCETSGLEAGDLERLIRVVRKAIDTPLPVPMRKDDDKLIKTINMAEDLRESMGVMRKLSHDFSANISSLDDSCIDRLARNRAWDEDWITLEDAKSYIGNEMCAVNMHSNRLHLYCDRFENYIDSIITNIRLMPEPYPGQDGDDAMYLPIELICRAWMLRGAIQKENFYNNEPCSDFSKFVCDIIECCVKRCRSFDDGYALPKEGLNKANIYNLRVQYERTLNRVYSLQPGYFNRKETLHRRKQQEAADREARRRQSADDLANILFEALEERCGEVKALMGETSQQLVWEALCRRFLGG